MDAVREDVKSSGVEEDDDRKTPRAEDETLQLLLWIKWRERLAKESG